MAPHTINLDFDDLRPLVSLGIEEFWHERCGFLIGSDEGTIDEVWPTENVSDDPELYFKMSKGASRRARARAKREGKVYIGTVHTHPPDGPTGPSDDDLFVARRFKKVIGAVFHPVEGTLTLYDGSGPLQEVQIDRPVWFRALARAYAFDL